MDDLGVVLASLVLTQLIITAVLWSLIAAARALDGPLLRGEGPNRLGRRDGAPCSGLPIIIHVNRPTPSGLLAATSQPVRGSGASTPTPVMFPMLSLVSLPVSQPGPAVTGFRAGASHAWPEPLVTTPPLVSLPVTSLAGLPISRPVLEGWLGGRKRGKGVARRRAIRKIVSGECSACPENRERGRHYCLDCGRRLTPFLS